MAKKNDPRQQIKDASKELKKVMQHHLSIVAANFVDQVMRGWRNLSVSQKPSAVNNMSPVGSAEYKAVMTELVATLADDAINAARKEVPKAKKVELADLKDLPPELRSKLKSQVNLMIGKQLKDLEAEIAFAYQANQDTMADEELEYYLMNEASSSWISGTSVQAGAEITASTVISNARNAFFFDDEVKSEIIAFQFTNGDPVTPICTDLDGIVFDKDDPDLFRYTPPLHWNAVSNGTLISIEAGKDIAIENIKVGDLVLTHTGRYQPVTEVMTKFEDKDIYDIVLENGKSLSVTAEHPILTNRGWVRVDELQMSDNVVCSEDVED